ncbi:MAG TPA: hypothetical protein VKF15_08400 [Nitrososphaerales archaeon]|nr:hypothetical protein [Nitrososphaerales archaeon]
MSDKELTDKSKYEIHVIEGDVPVIYLAEELRFEGGGFITFSPKHRIAANSKEKVSGSKLYFPSHRVEWVVERRAGLSPNSL